jgi:hypothetical protein
VTNPNNRASRGVIYPVWSLSSILTLTPITLNDFHNCDFFAMPYQTMEALRGRNRDLFDNFKATDVQVEFTPRSYTRVTRSSETAFSYLANCTDRIPEVTFDGPIPFTLIYH